MKIPFWPPFQGIRNIEFGLDRVINLLERLGNPHQQLPPTIHFAGTNGKGSTLNFLYQILKSHGLKAHCYTSPHLVEFNERIIIANNQIDDDFLNECLKICQDTSNIEPKIPVTFFEGITVAAFLAFSKTKADFLLLETGMGGRLDATNVLHKVLCSIITPISLDHTEFLGNSLKEITPEKAGIIKENCPVIIGKQDPESLEILKKQAQTHNSPTIIFNEDFMVKKDKNSFHYQTKTHNINIPNPTMSGSHQIDNFATAITAFNLILPKLAAKENYQNIAHYDIWPARLQKIPTCCTNNQLYIDGSHNKSGAQTILEFLKSHNKSKRTVIYSTLEDKDHEFFLKIIANEIDELIITTIPHEPKSQDPNIIQETAKSLNISSKIIREIDSSKLREEKKNKPTTTLITGSLYSAGYHLDNIFNKKGNNQ